MNLSVLNNEFVKAFFNLLAISAAAICIFNVFMVVPNASNYKSAYHPEHFGGGEGSKSKMSEFGRSALKTWFFADGGNGNGDLFSKHFSKSGQYSPKNFSLDTDTMQIYFTNEELEGRYCIGKSQRPFECYRWVDHRQDPFLHSDYLISMA